MFSPEAVCSARVGTYCLQFQVHTAELWRAGVQLLQASSGQTSLLKCFDLLPWLFASCAELVQNPPAGFRLLPENSSLPLSLWCLVLTHEIPPRTLEQCSSPLLARAVLLVRKAPLKTADTLAPPELT